MSYSRWQEFFQDTDRLFSSNRLVFILGSFIILSMAIMQFFGLGLLSTAIYGILATLVSGGYMVAKYTDSYSTPSYTPPDASLPPEGLQ